MGFWAELIDEDTARRVADICGPHSAHARALSEIAERRAAGEDVVLVTASKASRRLLIIPRSDVIDSIVPISTTTTHGEG